MPYLHLIPGAAVVPHGDGLLLATADERFAAISGTAAEIPTLHGILTGVLPVTTDGVGAEVPAAVLDWGAGRIDLEPAQPTGPWSLADLLPTEELAAALAIAPGLDRSPVRLVVSDVLDDAELSATDRPDASPWLPVHRELGALVAGPLLNGPAPRLTWADVRFRRRAASPARPQLAALWKAWSDHGTTYDVVPAADAVAAAGVRLLDLLAEEPAILLTHQVVVPCADEATPTTHPVLPVPQGLMAQVPA